ncbi:hypothetical protein [Zhongshania aliphaticivorans]|uniref:hypothetical protein n=1 Tax=Zhongshania aliphaticivorans TaxID=1470434 RepID=UPI0039C984BD
MKEEKTPTAEESFRAAFERLKKGCNVILEGKVPVTQNNVAREAGRDPSALKKNRYPLLVLEIQAFVKAQEDKARVRSSSKDNRTRSDKEKIQALRKQNGVLESMLHFLREENNALMEELDKLKTGIPLKIDR